MDGSLGCFLGAIPRKYVCTAAFMQDIVDLGIRFANMDIASCIIDAVYAMLHKASQISR